MTEEILAFVIWSIIGLCIIGFGVSALFSKKAVGFWANAQMFEVESVKKYNRAVMILFTSYGVILILLGLPLLLGESAWMILSILGVMFESIAAMIVYTVVIEKKYKK